MDLRGRQAVQAGNLLQSVPAMNSFATFPWGNQTMKRMLFAGVAALALVAGVSSKAEAAVALQLRICQGATCVDYFSGGPVSLNTGPFVVGDYTIENGGGSFVESQAFSQSQTSTLQVRRTGSTSAAPLDVFLQATGYMLPVGPAFNLDTTLSATSAPFNPGAMIEYVAVMSTSNAGGGVLPPPGPTTFTTAQIGCSPIAPFGPGSCAVNGDTVVVAPGAVPFSLTTRTRFNIAIGDGLLYGTNGQAIVTAVPEPMSLMLLGSGLLGLGATARRRVKK